MSQDSVPDSPRRYLYPMLFGLLLLSLILRVALTLNRELDMDEFQHLHSAWMVSRHFLIYRDFWEPHTPLLYYLLLPLFRLCGEGPRLVLAARCLMLLPTSGILLLTYALARLVHDRLTSLLAALVLSYMYIFMQKAVEIRPDHPLVLLWLYSLLIFVKALPRGRWLRFFCAGVVLGLACLFSPKALLPLSATSLTLLLLSGLTRPRRPFLDFLKLQCVYVCGFLLPLVVCFALFYRAGTLREMFRYTFLENFTLPHNVHPTYLLYLRNICFLLLACAGIAARVGRLGEDSPPRRTNHLALLLPGLSLLVVVLFMTPYPYPQLTLLFAPVLAVYAGAAVRAALDGVLPPRRTPGGSGRTRARPGAKAALVFAGAVAAALVIPCAVLLLRARPFTSTNSGQFELMEYALKLTRPTDFVFDGKCIYVFRPQAYFYGSLATGVIWRIQHGQIREDIPQNLISTGCKVVIYDERVAALPESEQRSIQAVIEADYEPTAVPEVYLAKGGK